MGDRVSIQFKDKDGTLSPVLFSHWGGMEFVKQARKYVKELKRDRASQVRLPLGRLEAQTVMVDFIRDITQKLRRVESDLYLGVSEYDGDNSDNGHHIILLG